MNWWLRPWQPSLLGKSTLTIESVACWRLGITVRIRANQKMSLRLYPGTGKAISLSIFKHGANIQVALTECLKKRRLSLILKQEIWKFWKTILSTTCPWVTISLGVYQKIMMSRLMKQTLWVRPKSFSQYQRLGLEDWFFGVENNTQHATWSLSKAAVCCREWLWRKRWCWNGQIIDEYRIDYLKDHIKAMKEAINDGVEIMGYLTCGALI